MENSPVIVARAHASSANIKRTLARSLITESVVGEATYVIIGTAVGALLSRVIPVTILVPWLAAVYVVAFVRFLVRRHFAAIPSGPPKVPTSLRAIIIAGGFTWGGGTLAFASHIPPFEFSLMMVVLCGLCAGAITTLLADPPSFYGLVAAMLAPLAIALLLSLDTPGFGIALLIVVMFATLITLSYRRLHRNFVAYLQAADALERSAAVAVTERRFLDQLIASVPSAIAVLDADQVITDINLAFEKLFGFTEAEVVGKSLEDLIVPMADRALSLAYAREVGEKGTIAVEAVRLRKGGEQIVVSICANRVATGEGTIIVAYEDITDRRYRERRNAAVAEINVALNAAKTEAELVPKVLKSTGQRLGWEIAALWRLDREHNSARCDEVWIAEQSTRTELADFIRGSRRSRRDGLIGRAWNERAAVWLNGLAEAFDIQPEDAEDSIWKGTAAAVLIELGGEVVAVVSFYSGDERSRDDAALDTMSAIAT
ncbi:MAG: PAS domain S-box protein, partial [Gemmatimonadaceae bacterium]